MQEKLWKSLSQTGLFRKVTCLTETWFDDRNSKRSLYQLPQYTANHQHRSPSHKSGGGKRVGGVGGISMYIHDSLNLTKFENTYGFIKSIILSISLGTLTLTFLITAKMKKLGNF